MTGTVSKATASFSNLSYGNGRQLHVLLVGPGGQSVVLMANSCAGVVASLNLTFDDAASASLPASGCSSGTYIPTSPPAFSFFPPAPSPPYGAALSAFNTVAPNGTWSLYVATDTSMAPVSGSMAGGWSLQLTGPTPPPPPPPPPPPGTSPPGVPAPIVFCGGQPATKAGTEGADVIAGSSGVDVIAGLGGNDRISGLGGKDILCGGAGNDKLKGGAGNDKLLGEAGKDTLKGGPGKDKLKGGPGKDTLVQ